MANRNLFILCLLPASALSAITPPEPVVVRQIAPAPSGPSSVDISTLQIDEGEDRTVPALPTGDRNIERQPLPQLATDEPSAAGPPALSSTAQSRPEPRTTLNGEDRCDPAHRNRLPTSACARVVETRSAEFDRTPPPLSPEQRLLLEQRTAIPTDRQGTARRLASGEGSQEDQAVASLALRRPDVPTDGKDEEKAALTREQAAAIVGAILNQPQP